MRRDLPRTLGPVLLLGLTARLIALLFSQEVEADAVTRTFIGWQWLSDPRLITEGVWGPLHTYMIGAALWVWEDPVFAPVIVNVLLSTLTAIPLYLFTAEEFDRRGAMFVCAAFLFYPIAFRNSLMALSEPACAFFVAIALMWVGRARRLSGTAVQALLAGASLTLAAMLRFEAWLLVPLFAVPLWRNPRRLVTFALAAAAFPVFWMIASYVHHADPLYSVRWATNWQLVVEGYNENLTEARVAVRALYYPVVLLSGLTPLVAGLVLLGVWRVLATRAAQTIWLLPLLGLVVVFVVKAIDGSLLLRARYGLLLGMLAFPFAADGLRSVAGGRPRRWHGVAAVAIIASMLPLSYPCARLLRAAFGIEEAGWDIEAVPRLDDGGQTARIAGLVAREMAAGDGGVIADFIGWSETYYALLLTRVHPDRIWVAPGGAHEELDTARLRAFLTAREEGVLLMREGSRFAGAWNTVDGRLRVIPPVGRTLETELRASVGDVRIYHYRARN